MVSLFSIQDVEQKDLFFKLNNVFSLSKNARMGKKVAGLYAIYKDDLCLYVGMSTNLPSRIATHLRGKYSSCTKVRVFTPEENGYEDFYERDSHSQKAILLNNEKKLMAMEKPVDNIDIDMDFVLGDEKSFDGLGYDNQVIDIVEVDDELHCKVSFNSEYMATFPEFYCCSSIAEVHYELRRGNAEAAINVLERACIS